MVEVDQDFEHWAGSFQTKPYTITDGINPLDISGVTEITWTFRPSNASSEVTYLLSLGEIAFITDGSDGEINVYLDEADFTNLMVGVGFYQIKIEGYSSHDYVVTTGALTIHESLA